MLRPGLFIPFGRGSQVASDGCGPKHRVTLFDLIGRRGRWWCQRQVGQFALRHASDVGMGEGIAWGRSGDRGEEGFEPVRHGFLLYFRYAEYKACVRPKKLQEICCAIQKI